MTLRTETLEDGFHKAMIAWKEKHFPDYDRLLEHWPRFYRQEPFRLVAKFLPLKETRIEVGDGVGREKFRTTRGMDDEMLERSRSIIRAQASTELGSIQQHRESLHKAQDDRQQFDVLRVMAEEFRHGYQMLYLLAADDWGGNVARETIGELLAMETGSHVLDAFNVFFDSFVDNIVFAAVIDRVGKYQLTMQKVFAYAPMAESMSPMLSEEAFHLATGMGPLKQWIREAALDRGNVSIPCIQKHLNKWIPRGLEMFGDERGGATNVRLGLKDLTNAQSMDRYHAECGEQVVDTLNLEILRVRGGADLSAEQAAAELRRIRERGKPGMGVRLEDLLRLPAKNFFRRRGVHAFEMADVDGHPMRDAEAYHRHLRGVLPDAYVTGRDFSTYLDNLQRHQSGQEVQERQLPFYG